MEIEDKRVTTRKAAEIAGMGYEGFRTCLKRGLLKHTGMLLPIVARDTPAPELDAKRWSWSEFGLADLCGFRLAKLLMDAGQSFDTANQLAGDDMLWQYFCHPDNLGCEETPSFMVIAGGIYTDYALYTQTEFVEKFIGDTANAEVALIVVNIKALREQVMKALSEA